MSMDTINMIETIATTVSVAGILLIIALWFWSRRTEKLNTESPYAERVRSQRRQTKALGAAWRHLITRRLGRTPGQMTPAETSPPEEPPTERLRRQRSRSEPRFETPPIDNPRPQRAHAARRESEKPYAQKPGSETTHAAELDVLEKPAERPRPERPRPERPPATRTLTDETVVAKPATIHRPSTRPSPDKPRAEEKHRATEETTAPPPEHTPRERLPRTQPVTEKPRLHIKFTLGLIDRTTHPRRVMWITMMNRGPSPLEITGLSLQAGNRRQGLLLLELDDPDHYSLPAMLNLGDRADYVVSGYDFDDLMYHIINKQTWFLRRQAIHSIRLLVETSLGKPFTVKPHKNLRKYIAFLATR